MAFLKRVLEPPSYGYAREQQLYVPTQKEMFLEFGRRINVFATGKNWMPAFSWMTLTLLAIPFVLFFTRFFSVPLFVAAFVYSMIFLGTHGTIWYHRYSTHRAYRFRHPIWRFFVKNLAIKIIPEELYVVSHHVHHAFSEEPGDPYNVNAGWWYCFLADAIHQPISRSLTQEEYLRVTKLVDHTGIHINSFKQYQRWGSVAHPAWTLLHFTLNWAFWYGVFYLIGGHPLAITLFGAAGFWAFGIRTFNFAGHGAGRDKRKDGIDFNRQDLSINQVWPGMVTGEWHNNHHLYPNGARAGFLPYQIDFAWYFIRGLHLVGGVSSYRDPKEEFFRDHYEPYLRSLAVKKPLALSLGLPQVE